MKELNYKEKAGLDRIIGLGDEGKIRFILLRSDAAWQSSR